MEIYSRVQINNALRPIHQKSTVEVSSAIPVMTRLIFPVPSYNSAVGEFEMEDFWKKSPASSVPVLSRQMRTVPSQPSQAQTLLVMDHGGRGPIKRGCEW